MAGQVESLHGRRVVLVNDDGQFGDYRVWGELRLVAGVLLADVVRERHWYAFDLMGIEPRLLEWPAGALWLE